jgi:hypothetical protein
MPRDRKIIVESESPGNYRVVIDEGSSKSVHQVHLTSKDVAKYSPGQSPETLLRASFAFLLERESKESILPEFALPVIERYFPDFPKKIHSYF